MRSKRSDDRPTSSGRTGMRILLGQGRESRLYGRQHALAEIRVVDCIDRKEFEDPRDLFSFRAQDHQHPADRGIQRCADHGLQDALVSQGKEHLGPSHPLGFAGCEDDGPDHGFVLF